MGVWGEGVLRSGSSPATSVPRALSLRSFLCLRSFRSFEALFSHFLFLDFVGLGIIGVGSSLPPRRCRCHGRAPAGRSNFIARVANLGTDFALQILMSLMLRRSSNVCR